MAGHTKKRSGRRTANAVEETDMDIRKASRVDAVDRYEDMEQDSEDEFIASRDKVLLGHDRRLARHDGGSDNESDEEVMAVKTANLSSSEEDEEDEESEEDFYSGGEDAEQELEDEDGAWGKQKYNYYDADDIGTDTDDDEAAAKEEEEEALRLQKKQLEALDEADFIDELGAELGVDMGGESRLVSSMDDGNAQIDLDRVSLDVSGQYDLSTAK
ncbi:something about silencing protein 10, partial [Linderina pennispora]